MIVGRRRVSSVATKGSRARGGLVLVHSLGEVTAGADPTQHTCDEKETGRCYDEDQNHGRSSAIFAAAGDRGKAHVKACIA